MKFGHLFEYHKIPEWYTEYMHYKELKQRIDNFKNLTKVEKTRKLKGYYMVNKAGQFYCIDFIKDFSATKNKLQRKARNSQNVSHLIPDSSLKLEDSEKQSLKTHENMAGKMTVLASSSQASPAFEGSPEN